MAARFEEDAFGLERALETARLDPNLCANLETVSSAFTSVTDMTWLDPTVPSIADVAWLDSTIPSVTDLARLDSTIPSIADVARLDSTVPSIADALGALNTSSMLMDATLGTPYSDLSLAQQFAPADYSIDLNALSMDLHALTPYWQRLDSITHPLAEYMSTISAASEMEAVTSSWKPALMQSWLSEQRFITQMPTIEQTLYSAIRPDILSVADQLSQELQLPLQNMIVDYMGTPVELDLDFYLNPGMDLDAMPFVDEPTELDSADSRVIVREVIVWLDGNPQVLRLIGKVVGGGVASGVGWMVDGAAGALLAGSASPVLTGAFSKGLVVIVRRCRNRL